MKKLFMLLSSFLLAVPALAGGSFIFQEDLEPLLEKDRRIGAFIMKSMDFDDVGDATRLGRHFSHLGGKRIGPYSVYAKTKGSTGPYNLIVTVKTEATFIDEDGRPLDHGKAGQRLFDDSVNCIEKITSVEIQDIKIEEK